MTTPKTEEEELLDKYHDLRVLGQSRGGKILVAGHIQDIISSLSILAAQYKSLTHIEMIAICAGLNEKLNAVRAITRAEEAEKELTEQLHT